MSDDETVTVSRALIDDYEKRIARRDQRLDELEALIREWDAERTEKAAKVANLVRLLRQQVSRLWAYHDWVGAHDCQATSSEDGFETARITITRRITPDGDDQTGFYVAPEDMALVETLGLLRLAEDTAITEAAR